MKIRTGFVSNSSTSSFVCDVCGEIHEGMDLDYEDAEIFECVNGHIVCWEHIPSNLQDDWEALVDSRERSWDRYNDVPERFCPLCRLDVLDPKDVLKYVLKTAGVELESVENEIKAKFGSYSDLIEYNYPDEE